MAVAGLSATLELCSIQALLTPLCWSCVGNGSLSFSSLTHEHLFSCVSTKVSFIGTSKWPRPVTQRWRRALPGSPLVIKYVKIYGSAAHLSHERQTSANHATSGPAGSDKSLVIHSGSLTLTLLWLWLLLQPVTLFLHIPFFHSDRMGELLLIRGSVWQEWARVDHFRAKSPEHTTL